MELPGMLVDAGWLRAQRSHDRASPDLVVADVRWVPGGHARDRYAQGHLPGAVCVDVDSDLAAAAFDGPGRHPLPSPEAFAASMSRVGIGDRTSVVAYDDAGGSVAARLWWMLRVLHRPVALLDLPSLDAWSGAGGELQTGPPADRPQAAAAFTPRPWPDDRVVDADTVRAALRSRSAVLLDVRSGERYRGEAEPFDPVAGHVPGAVSAEWARNRDDEGRFLDPVSSRRWYESLGVRDDGEAIASCGSGVTATFALFAMERAGLGFGRLYEGSWSDWVSDRSRPVAIGTQPGEPS
ncbi:MAG: sulfurtransferase [Actinomycetota bacterium]|nr:sulfurtransferase [Actinomycetota bacterium]MDH5314541.1 sulfurtransferase [Actinomycetota bacterium]